MKKELLNKVGKLKLKVECFIHIYVRPCTNEDDDDDNNNNNNTDNNNNNNNNLMIYRVLFTYVDQQCFSINY